MYNEFFDQGVFFRKEEEVTKTFSHPRKSLDIVYLSRPIEDHNGEISQ